MSGPPRRELAERRALVVRAIHDPKTNPYLLDRWAPSDLLRRAGSLPDTIIEPWIRSIEHLQTIAWRLHSPDCDPTKEPICVGCLPTRTGGVPVVRPYFHPKQMEFIAYNGYEAWCITSKRFGKTEALLFLGACRCFGYNPITNQFRNIPIKGWIVGLDFPMVRDRLVPGFLGFLPAEHTRWSGDAKAWDYQKTDLLCTLFTESIMGFKSADSGMTKFQSVDRDLILVDEEIDEAVYKECRMRLPGGGRTLEIRGAMTPNLDLGLTWSYDELFANETRQADPMDLKIITGSIYENPAIGKRQIDALAKNMTPHERDVLLYGKYDLGKGRGAFDGARLGELLLAKRPPLRTEQWPSGELRIWEEPEPGEAYCLGADSSEGLSHGDNSSAHLLRRTDTGTRVAATLVGRGDPDLFGRDLVELARRYANAWVLPEANTAGLVAIKAMRTLAYPYIFRPQAKQGSPAGAFENRRWGWYTSVATRPILVEGLKTAVRERTCAIWDEDTIKEMLSFIQGPDGKYQAQGNRKDDRVMSLALAVQAHLRCPLPKQLALAVPLPPDKDAWRKRRLRATSALFEEPVSDGMEWLTA